MKHANKKIVFLQSGKSMFTKINRIRVVYLHYIVNN